METFCNDGLGIKTMYQRFYLNEVNALAEFVPKLQIKGYVKNVGKILKKCLRVKRKVYG